MISKKQLSSCDDIHKILEITSGLTLNVLKSRHFKRVTTTPPKVCVIMDENASPTLQKLVKPHKNTRPLCATPKGRNFFTPQHKTAMFLLTIFGPFTLLDEQEMVEDCSTSEAEIHANYNHSAKQYLKDAEEKNMTASFTLHDIEKVKIKKKKNEGKREISQEEAMIADKIDARLASANTIARKSTLSTTDQKSHEWNHLIAYRFLGEAGQHSKNLVLATIQCNSLMMIIEEKTAKLLRLLGKTFPRKKTSVTLNVKADTLEGTHIGTCIHYHIMAFVDGHCVFNLKVKFDPNLKKEPPRTLDIYVTALFNYALSKQGKLISFDSPSPSDLASKSKSTDDIIPTVLNF